MHILVNLVLIIVILGMLWLFITMETPFVLGFILATLLFQVSYRLRHGCWFDIEPKQKDFIIE